ncbi:hypothetical protein N8920_02185 [Opitutales bacterium]|nr:hypothetical protein [Opitutales bacterium]
MKINPRFINNENNEAYSGNNSKKVSKIHNIEDLSPDTLKRFEQLRKKLSSMLSHQGQIGDANPLLSLLSFQAFQIGCLQRNAVSLEEVNIYLAKKVDALIGEDGAH